ncbi:MAG: hypothetical protein QXX94_02165 [Candidatus Bathyarchaeia archaeon]
MPLLWINNLGSAKIWGPIQRCLNHPESLTIGLCSKCYGSFCGDCLFLVMSIRMEGKTVIIDRIFLCAKCRDGTKDGGERCAYN